MVKKHSDIRTVHYVAPSVWAWRPRRAKRMARVIDHVLALLPFEPPYMEAEGMACDFVGHPVVAEPVASQVEIAEFRHQFNLGDAPVLLVLPGSRRGEVERLGPIFGEAIRRYLTDRPDMRVVVPTVATVADRVRELVANWPGDPVVLDAGSTAGEAHKRAAFATAELSLAASGTVSLELAAAQTPMVIAYRFQWLTMQITQHMALIDTVTLVNLVSDTRAVPECLGADCTPENIARELGNVARAPDRQTAAMALTMDRLGRGADAPGLRAARAVLARL